MSQKTYRDYNYVITNKELREYLKEKYKLTNEDFLPNIDNLKPILKSENINSGLNKTTIGIEFYWTLVLESKND